MSTINSITTDLVHEVIKEAKLLRRHATAEEKAKLNFDQLNSIGVGDCIYGQMTGDCFSQRSIELLRLCAKMPFGSRVPTSRYNVVNLDVSDEFSSTPFDRYFSAIEVYIGFPGADTKQLIDFIQGKTDSLLLNFDTNE